MIVRRSPPPISFRTTAPVDADRRRHPWPPSRPRPSSADRPATLPRSSRSSSTQAWATLYLNLGTADRHADQPEWPFIGGETCSRRTRNYRARLLGVPATRSGRRTRCSRRSSTSTACATRRSSTRSAASTSRRATSTCSCSASAPSRCSGRSARRTTSTSSSPTEPGLAVDDRRRGRSRASTTRSSRRSGSGGRSRSSRTSIEANRVDVGIRATLVVQAGHDQDAIKGQIIDALHTSVNSAPSRPRRPLLGRDADRPDCARRGRRAEPPPPPLPAGVRRHQLHRRAIRPVRRAEVGENVVLAPDEVAQFSIDSRLIDIEVDESLSVAFLDTMRQGLTPAYHRGMEQFELSFGATAANGMTAIQPYDFGAYQQPLRRPAPAVAAVPPRRRVSRHADPLDRARLVQVATPNQRRGPSGRRRGVPAGWPAGRGIAVPIRGPGGRHRGTGSGSPAFNRSCRPASSPRTGRSWRSSATSRSSSGSVGWEHEELALPARRRRVSAERAAPARRQPRPARLRPRRAALPAPAAHVGCRTPLRSTTSTTGRCRPQLEVTDGASTTARGTRPTSHPGQNNGAHSGRDGPLRRAPSNSGRSSTSVTIDGRSRVRACGRACLHRRGSREAGSHKRRRPERSSPSASLLNTAADAGWALTIGSFRGFDHNVRFSLSDGTTEVELFADRDLGDGVFHHRRGRR